jgi:hypothetical protein
MTMRENTKLVQTKTTAASNGTLQVVGVAILQTVPVLIMMAVVAYSTLRMIAAALHIIHIGYQMVLAKIVLATKDTVSDHSNAGPRIPIKCNPHFLIKWNTVEKQTWNK